MLTISTLKIETHARTHATEIETTHSPLLLLRRTSVDDTAPTTQLLQTFARKRLSEQIRQLITRLDEIRLDDTGADAVADEMKPDVDVLTPIVKHRVPRQRQGRLVVNVQQWRDDLGVHQISEQA